MKDIYSFLERENITRAEIEKQFNILIETIDPVETKNILLVPPDITRYYSMGGMLTEILYDKLSKKYNVDIMPALGTHRKMTLGEISKMFGTDIPKEKFLTHDYRKDVVLAETIPEEVVYKLSEGLLSDDIDIEVNKNLVSGKYDLVLSIGQVVPHEVIGMSNYSKNIFVGLGGEDLINKTHIIGALYGIENIIGETENPARNLLDYVEKNYSYNIPCIYILTVVTVENDEPKLHGLYVSNQRRSFEKAAKKSRQLNITYVNGAVHKVVTYMDDFEYKSLWVANKSIYRTRKIIADGGELLVIAPGVRSFGENTEINEYIKKYGYKGRRALLDIYKNDMEARKKLMALAHLMHGSTEGRFNVTYALEYMSKNEIESVGYKYMNIHDALKRYNPDVLKEGYNEMPDGEKIYFVKRPASGLWTLAIK